MTTFIQFAVTVKNIRGQESTYAINAANESEARKVAMIQHPFVCIVYCNPIPAAWLVK